MEENRKTNQAMQVNWYYCKDGKWVCCTNDQTRYLETGYIAHIRWELHHKTYLWLENNMVSIGVDYDKMEARDYKLRRIVQA